MLNTMITMTVSSHTLVPIRKSQNNENKFCEIKCLGSTYLNVCEAEIVDLNYILFMIIFIMSIAKIKNKWFIKKSILYLNRLVFLWINIAILSLNHMQLSCTSKRRVRCALYNNQDHGTLFKTLRDFQTNKCNSNHCSPRAISPKLMNYID